MSSAMMIVAMLFGMEYVVFGNGLAAIFGLLFATAAFSLFDTKE
jgi:hypothetical protein